MILNKIEDPRDNLERAKLGDLVRYANAHGLKHVSYDTPAILIRRELRQRGLVDIRTVPRPLGAQARRPDALTTNPSVNQKTVEVGAADDLARQFAQQQMQPPPPPLPKPGKPEKPKRLVERPKSEINKMRDFCKEHGIKMSRRDRMPDLKAKIEAHKAQNGQDPPQLRQ